jgi:putative alpha-1,2-mannosidase
MIPPAEKRTMMRRVLIPLITAAAAVSIGEIGTCHAKDDLAGLVHVVQSAWPIDQGGHETVALLRYPLGRIGLWSTDVGEIADSVTRNLRLYPCIDEIRKKFEDDWRESITGDASRVDIRYKKSKPSNGSMVSLTVTPNVSVYRYRFSPFHEYGAVVIQVQEKLYPNWAKAKWTDTRLKIIDDRTIEVELLGPSVPIYYCLKFNQPAVGFGTLSGFSINEGVAGVSGDDIGGYMRFRTSEVTVAVAISHTSVERAKSYIRSEFNDMDFDTASLRLREEWDRRLGKIEVEGNRNTRELFYTALHTVYTNIISAADGSLYATPHPFTVSSSDFWQFLGGFLRCNWDSIRATYPLLMLIEPELMSHILNTYLAINDREGKIYGNGCLFSGPYEGARNYAGNLFLAGFLHGIEGVDYAKAAQAVKNNIVNNYTPDFFTKGYIPLEADVESVSHTMEYSTMVQGMALLAGSVGDTSTYRQYAKYGKSYGNVWNSETRQFRARLADGSWNAAGGDRSTGFYEGTEEDWAFAVPHDPYGLMDLYGNRDAVARLKDICGKGMMNDYQLNYQFLPIYANDPGAAQTISRNIFVPKFKSCVIAEGFWPTPTGVYYTSNGAAVVCTMLGLFMMPAPGAQWVIGSPTVDKAVIHGKSKITITASHNSTQNVYIGSLRMNGQPFPAYMISGRRLASSDIDMELKMTNRPTPMGDLYLISSDGEVLSAAGNSSNLEFELDPIGGKCGARVYSKTKPSRITVDGSAINSWRYDNVENIVYINAIPNGIVEVSVQARQ